MAKRELTLDQLDQALADWQSAITNLSANLGQLTSLLSYSLYTATDGSARKMTGTTSELVPPALAAAKQLKTDFGLLSPQIDRATAARLALPKRPSREQIDAIVAMLDEDTVELADENIPLEQRDAFSSGKNKKYTSCNKLKDAIAKNFRIAKDVLMRVDKAWLDLHELLKTAKADAEALKAKAREAHKDELPEETSLFQRIAGLERQLSSDPLGTPTNIKGELEPYMQHVRDRLTALQGEVLRRQEAIALQVTEATAALESLRALRVRALELHQQAITEVDDPQGLVAPPSVKDLGEWLVSLKQAQSESRWHAVTEGLVDWRRKHDELQSSLNQAIAANEKPVNKRAQLVKRWADAQANTAAFVSRGGVVDKALNSFKAVAEAALTGKVKLEEAETAVYSYETRLGELSARLGK